MREVGYLSRLEDLEVFPGVAGALGRLGEAGWLRLVVSNQSGVARGIVAEAFVRETHRALCARLQRDGGDLDGMYACPHHPELTGPCACRKPAPGLILEAAEEWEIDLSRSWVVGDKQSDLDAGRAAGCRTILVRTGYGLETEREPTGDGADFVADDLAAAVERILMESG